MIFITLVNPRLFPNCFEPSLRVMAVLPLANALDS